MFKIGRKKLKENIKIISTYVTKSVSKCMKYGCYIQIDGS